MARDIRPPTIDDVMRELARVPSQTDKIMRSCVIEYLHGPLALVARKARVAWASGDVTVMTEALAALTVAEDAAGVDLTTPTEEDLA